MSHASRRRRTALGLATAAALTAPLAFVPAAVAAPPEGAGQPASGSCKIFDDPQFNGWTSYEEMVAKLGRIEATSGGRVDVEVVGQTKEGRDFHAARVGTG